MQRCEIMHGNRILAGVELNMANDRGRNRAGRLILGVRYPGKAFRWGFISGSVALSLTMRSGAFPALYITSPPNRLHDRSV